MSKLIEQFSSQLSVADFEIIENALDSLFRERMIAFNISVRVSKEQGLPEPRIGDFGLPDILRLSRMMNNRPTAPV